MDYDDFDKLYDDLNMHTKEALKKTAIEIRLGWEDIIRTEIYGKFEPSEYIRQKELLKSIVIEPIENPSTGYYCITIRPKDEKHKFNLTWNENILPNTNFSEIFHRFAEGFRMGMEIDIPKMTEEEYLENNKAIDIIIKYLSQWFDIE